MKSLSAPSAQAKEQPMYDRDTRGDGDLIAMRDAFQNGTTEQRAQASAYFETRKRHMAELQQETRVSFAARRLAADDDAELERILRDTLACLEASERHDAEYPELSA
jgi:hypothetical protein